MKTPAQILRDALELLGPEGVHWVRGYPCGDRMCCLSAIYGEWFRNQLSTGKAEGIFSRVISDRFISRWNDAPGRTWPEIRAAFLKAIELAEAATA